MIGRKKPRKNYRKGRKKNRSFVFLRRLVICLYVIAGIAGLLATSGLFVLIHDVITQCDYFKADRLKIEGVRRLTPKEIVAVARVKKGMNVLSVNLAMTRKRLLAHPWIAEAEVRREIPSGLHIRIQEHTPLAIVDLGRRYLINENGTIFKEWADTDPDNLPLVSGLDFSDIRNQNNTASTSLQRPKKGFNQPQTDRPLNRPFEAVMEVLNLGKHERSILSNRNIKEIKVDREIGITLKAFNQMKTIVLGYHNYRLKYSMLKNILAYRKQRRSIPDFTRIDLNNVKRIVVNPVDKISLRDHKEV